VNDVERRARLEAVVREVAEPVRRYLIRRVGPFAAEDVLSDVLLACWRRIDDIPADALPWAYGVARRCLANARRAAARREQLGVRLRALEPPAVAFAAEEGDDAIAVRAALERLRVVDAEVLRLWAWEGLEAADIAVALGITPNAAAIRLHRAKSRLRAELGKDRPGSGHVEHEGMEA